MPTNNDSVKEVIKSYLDERAANDEQFAVSYAKEHKNINDCIKYILSEAAKRGSTVCMTDDEVFGLAVHYYDEDNLKFNRNIQARSHVSEPVKLSEKQKKKAEEAAMLKYEEECLREMRERNKKRRVSSSKPDITIGSLFDLAV